MTDVSYFGYPFDATAHPTMANPHQMILPMPLPMQQQPQQFVVPANPAYISSPSTSQIANAPFRSTPPGRMPTNPLDTAVNANHPYINNSASGSGTLPFATPTLIPENGTILTPGASITAASNQLLGGAINPPQHRAPVAAAFNSANTPSTGPAPQFSSYPSSNSLIHASHGITASPPHMIASSVPPPAHTNTYQHIPQQSQLARCAPADSQGFFYTPHPIHPGQPQAQLVYAHPQSMPYAPQQMPVQYLHNPHQAPQHVVYAPPVFGQRPQLPIPSQTHYAPAPQHPMPAAPIAHLNGMPYPHHQQSQPMNAPPFSAAAGIATQLPPYQQSILPIPQLAPRGGPSAAGTLSNPTTAAAVAAALHNQVPGTGLPVHNSATRPASRRRTTYCNFFPDNVHLCPYGDQCAYAHTKMDRKMARDKLKEATVAAAAAGLLTFPQQD